MSFWNVMPSIQCNLLSNLELHSLLPSPNLEWRASHKICLTLVLGKCHQEVLGLMLGERTPAGIWQTPSTPGILPHIVVGWLLWFSVIIEHGRSSYFLWLWKCEQDGAEGYWFGHKNWNLLLLSWKIWASCSAICTTLKQERRSWEQRYNPFETVVWFMRQEVCGGNTQGLHLGEVWTTGKMIGCRAERKLRWPWSHPLWFGFLGWGMSSLYSYFLWLKVFIEIFSFGKIYVTKITTLTIFKCTVQWHQVHSWCCAAVTTACNHKFYHPEQKLCNHYKITTPFPLPQPLVTSILLLVFMNLPVLGTSH